MLRLRLLRCAGNMKKAHTDHDFRLIMPSADQETSCSTEPPPSFHSEERSIAKHAVPSRQPISDLMFLVKHGTILAQICMAYKPGIYTSRIAACPYALRCPSSHCGSHRRSPPPFQPQDKEIMQCNGKMHQTTEAKSDMKTKLHASNLGAKSRDPSRAAVHFHQIQMPCLVVQGVKPRLENLGTRLTAEVQEGLRHLHQLLHSCHEPKKEIGLRNKAEDQKSLGRSSGNAQPCLLNCTHRLPTSAMTQPERALYLLASTMFWLACIAKS